jgi:hypothetical protein
MSRCLCERTLWGIYEGEGTAAQQAHLQTCVACHVRYQALVHTLERIFPTDFGERRTMSEGYSNSYTIM